MQKETIIAQELTSYSMIERFDTACCRLLANKPILAWLLRDTVEDYQPCSIEEIMGCLEVKSKFVCKFLQALKSLGCSHINLADCCSLQLGRDITFHHFFVALVRKDSLACLSLFVQLHQR